jgi:hypothetical protein
MRQGSAPWRGTGELLAPDDFFLILGAAIQSHKNAPSASAASYCTPTERCYFLNKLSKAARASFALRGAGTDPLSEIFAIGPEGKASRATVTRGKKSSQELA